MRLDLASPLATLVALALAAALLGAGAAQACDAVRTECLPRIVVFPAYTAEGARVGTVEAPVRHIMRLERSRFTGQPLPVVYNNPGSLAGAVGPDLVLMPLPRVAPFRTQAVYPRGY